MAEIRFENVLACEDGERIERRVPKPSFFPVETQEQIQQLVRKRSIFQPNFNFTMTSAREDKTQETLISPSRRPSTSHVHFNLDSFSCENKENEPSSHLPTTSQTLPDGDQHNVIPDQEYPLHQRPNAQAWLGEHHGARRPSLVPSLLPLPLGVQGQKGGEQREEMSRRPSIMPMDEDDDGLAPLEKPSPSEKVGKLKRPPLRSRKTAPETVDGVLVGA